MGKSVRVSDMVENKPYEEFSQKELKLTAEKIQTIMQKELLDYKKKYGKKFYDIKGLLKSMWQNRRLFFRYFPMFWPLVMTYFEVNYDEKIGKDSLKFSFKKCVKTILKRPIVLAMYLPVLGWLFIWLKTRSIMKKRC